MLLKIIHILHPRYYSNVGHILKNKQKNKCVYIHQIIRLIVMKNRSHIHDINLGTRKKDLGLDMDTNIVNIRNV